jgi:hypothetical protein
VKNPYSKKGNGKEKNIRNGTPKKKNSHFKISHARLGRAKDLEQNIPRNELLWNYETIKHKLVSMEE